MIIRGVFCIKGFDFQKRIERGQRGDVILKDPFAGDAFLRIKNVHGNGRGWLGFSMKRQKKKNKADDQLHGNESSGNQIWSWDFKFAGDAGLAEAAGRNGIFQSVFQMLCPQRFGSEIIPTSVFVVTFLRYGAPRAPGNALPAFPIPELKTILFRVVIALLTGGQLQEGNHASDPHGHSLGRDKPVVETECPQAAGKGGVTL
jgi:hypothetical protein